MEVPRNLEDIKKAIDLMKKDIDFYNLKMKENQMKRFEVEQLICETEMLIEKAGHIIKTNERKNEDYGDKISELGNNFKVLSKLTFSTQKNKSLDNLLVKVENLTTDKINYKIEFDKINSTAIDLEKKKEALQQVKKKLRQVKECSEEILSKLYEF